MGASEKKASRRLKRKQHKIQTTHNSRRMRNTQRPHVIFVVVAVIIVFKDKSHAISIIAYNNVMF